ncbi:MAG: HAD hydrolase-like protein [Polyangiales bacterium]
MPRYDLAVFDFDGTLVDSLPWLLTVMNDAARRFGFREVADDEVERLRAMDHRAILAHLGLPLWRLPQVATHVRALAAAGPPSPRFAGVDALLPALRAAGVRVAVVSSNAEETIRRGLGPLASHVERVDGGASLWGKARKLRATVRALGVTPARTLAIGDELRDVEAARAAGLAAGAVTWGYHHAAVLRAAAPDHIFDDIAALRATLLG